MPDEEIEPEVPDDGGERAFWEQFDARSEAAYERVLARLSAQVDEEEETQAEKPKPAPKPKTEGEEDGGTADHQEPTPAQRQRDAGRVGPGSESPYWQRARRFLYGRDR